MHVPTGTVTALMRPTILLCTAIVSLGVAGASPLHAQTAGPSASPAASLAADPNSVAASPTPLATIAPGKIPAATAKTRDRSANPKILEKYDTDKNGQIDPEEKTAMKKDRATRREERLKKYDKNGDGRLDDTEKAAIKPETKLEKKSGKSL